LFTLPGVGTREIEPWSEVGETWHRLEVTFPSGIATHNTVQTYYFDSDTGLQRRMDYSPTSMAGHSSPTTPASTVTLVG
jgi:hypothetical protein